MARYIDFQTMMAQTQHANAATSVAPPKSRFDGYPTNGKQMLLHATHSTAVGQPATNLRPALLQIINCSKEHVLQELQNLLLTIPRENNGRNYDGIKDQGLAMLIRHAHFIPNDEFDTCLSVFVTAPVTVMRGYNNRNVGISPEEWELGFQEGGSVAHDRIKDILKVSVWACSNYYDAVRQMINWKLLLAGLFGPLSMAALTMDDLISQVEQHAAMMAGKAFRDRHHMPGLLQYISNMFAQYFSACSNRSLSMAPPTIDTTFISQKIRAQDSFKAPMDQIVREAMDRGSNKPSPTNKQKDKNKHRNKDDGSPRKPANKKSKNGGGLAARTQRTTHIKPTPATPALTDGTTDS
jgi:hypothetical protein